MKHYILVNSTTFLITKRHDFNFYYMYKCCNKLNKFINEYNFVAAYLSDLFVSFF